MKKVISSPVLVLSLLALVQSQAFAFDVTSRAPSDSGYVKVSEVAYSRTENRIQFEYCASKNAACTQLGTRAYSKKELKWAHDRLTAQGYGMIVGAGVLGALVVGGAGLAVAVALAPAAGSGALALLILPVAGVPVGALTAPLLGPEMINVPERLAIAESAADRFVTPGVDAQVSESSKKFAQRLGKVLNYISQKKGR